MQINLRITNIDCAACIKLSQTALKGLPGVLRVAVKNNGLVLIESEQDIAWEEITEALVKVGKNAKQN